MHVCVNESVQVRERAHVHLCVCVCVCVHICFPSRSPTAVTLRQQLFDPTFDPVAHAPMLLLSTQTLTQI